MIMCRLLPADKVSEWPGCKCPHKKANIDVIFFLSFVSFHFIFFQWSGLRWLILQVQELAKGSNCSVPSRRPSWCREVLASEKSVASVGQPATEDGCQMHPWPDGTLAENVSGVLIIQFADWMCPNFFFFFFAVTGPKVCQKQVVVQKCFVGF